MKADRKNQLQVSRSISTERLSGGWFKHQWLLVLFALMGAGSLLLVNWIRLRPVMPRPQQTENAHLSVVKSPQTLAELLSLPTSEIERNDIALMNLLCAQGLPGADGASVPDSLATLDQWARHVQTETDRHLYRFRAKPEEFYSSEGYFRMLIMAVVMYEDFGIHYNPERIAIPERADPNDHFFADSRDIFLPGLIGSRRLGTCSSMPVLYVAVGRRLGYPLKLVSTKGHLFLRWEDEKERFNLEATGKGMNRYDNDHFRQWPFPVSDEEIRTEGYLKSMTASEELAVFLSLRANCLKEDGRFPEAIACYSQAARLAPNTRGYRLLLAAVEKTSVSNAPPQQVSLPMQGGGVVLQPVGRSSTRQTRFGPDPNPLLKTH